MFRLQGQTSGLRRNAEGRRDVRQPEAYANFPALDREQPLQFSSSGDVTAPGQ
jgi:hypothetical protein